MNDRSPMPQPLPGTRVAAAQMTMLIHCAKGIEAARIRGDTQERAEWRDEIGEAERRPEDVCCASFAKHLLDEDAKA